MRALDGDTRRAVLRALTATPDGYVSGEQLSRTLGLTRAAVWKQIEALRAAGYTVESRTKKGYRLVAAPADSLSTVALLPGLQTRALGQRLEHRAQVSSTNELSKELARAGAPHGLVVVADEQLQGKGRLGRQWHSPAGAGLWCTTILRPDLPPQAAPRMTLAAAVAVCRAVRRVANVDAAIKWPNDLQIKGRKFCGILTEMEADLDAVHFAVVGIGINLRTSAVPPDLAAVATSLEEAGADSVSRMELLGALLTELEAQLELVQAGQFPAVLDQWRAYTNTLGRRVAVIPVAGREAPWEGQALDVDLDGALLVRRGDGTIVAVNAGEVSVRPQNG